jgi:hypothetical protein
MAQIQIQKVVKKQELEKKGEEGLDGYTEILQDIKSLLEKARYKAYKAVDNLRVQTYWQIGERIVRGELQHRERADYGERVIERLASDLDIAKRNLHNTVRFYRVYPIVQTVSAQLSWSHFVVLIYLNNKEERLFYEQQTIQNAWSVRELRRIICKTKDEETVHYALGDLKREIFVAEYKVKLPSEEEIKRYL